MSVFSSAYPALRPLLFLLDAERAHHLTLSALRCAHSLRIPSGDAKVIDQRTVMGINFTNPVGLAAGLDKDAAYIDGLAALGFGFIEVGTVTPRPQAGNAKPRLFRLPKAQAIINRMGFNNGGVDACVANVQASQYYQNKRGILGINIGKNADTPIERAVEDYLICLHKVYAYADYVTINISSPNTKNLRQLQQADALHNLLQPLKQAQKELSELHKRYVPLALKVAPDVDAEQIKLISHALVEHGIDGLIVSNTTLSRNTVDHLPHGHEAGGLSGAPVFDLSNRALQLFKAELGDAIPIIGVGGILSGADAQAKMRAGAALVQIYSGLIYRGPGLVTECALSLKQPSHY